MVGKEAFDEDVTGNHACQGEACHPFRYALQPGGEPYTRTPSTMHTHSLHAPAYW